MQSTFPRFAMLLAMTTALATAGSVYLEVGTTLGTLNTTTGVFSPIGANTGLFGLAFGSDGTLYGNDFQSNNNFYNINPANGSKTLIGSTGVPTNGGIASAPSGGTIFFFAGTNVYSVNTGTGAGTLIGSMSPASTTGTNDFGPAVGPDGNLYFVDDTGLYAINPGTGASTFVGSTGLSLAQLFGFGIVTADGVLYGISQSEEYTVNLATGAATPFLSLNLPGVVQAVAPAFSPAQAVTPEPSSWVLCGSSGLVLIVCVAMRRRRIGKF